MSLSGSVEVIATQRLPGFRVILRLLKEKGRKDEQLQHGS